MRLLNNAIWHLRNKGYRKSVKDLVKNRNCTIVSSNCIGGVVYNTYSMQFLSPTINLSMNYSDFIKLCENTRHYFESELKPYTGDLQKSYPLADLDGLTLHLVHYSTFEEAKEFWDRRVQRVNYDNMFFVCTNQEGFNEELSARFDALPQPKVLFVNQPDDNPNHFYIKGFEDRAAVGDITAHSDQRSGHRILEAFDWVSFLDHKLVKKE